MSQDTEQTREFVQQLTSHQPALRAFILSQMPGTPGVADVLQQVNLLLWEKMAKYEPGSNFRAWAFAVARYKIMEHRRQLKRDGWLLFDDDLVADIGDEFSEDSGDVESFLQALESCMGKLSPEERELLETRYASAGTIKDYAEQTGREPGTLRVTLHRLRMALRDCILKTMAEEERPSNG